MRGGLARRFLPGLHPSRGGRSPIVGGGGGVAPTITVAPVLAWTVAHGSSPTITEGTYTGDAGTWTYDLVRLPSTTVLSGVSKATVEAYVADRATDVGPDWKVTGTITNGSGSDSADSNLVTWDRSTLPIAGGYSGAGLTLADSGTTVDAWASSIGSVSATLTAPTASERLAYSATGGVGSRPLVTSTTGKRLTGTITKGSAFASAEIGFVGSQLTYLGAGAFMSYAATIEILNNGATLARGRWSALPSSTTLAGTIAHWSTDGTASGTLSMRVGGTAEGTDTAGTSVADGGVLCLGNRAATAYPTNSGFQAWYIGPQLTADQRLDLRALLTYLTGVSS